MQRQFEEMKKLKVQAETVLDSLKALKKNIRDYKGDVQLRVSMNFLDEDLEFVEKMLGRVAKSLEYNCIELYIKENMEDEKI